MLYASVIVVIVGFPDILITHDNLGHIQRICCSDTSLTQETLEPRNRRQLGNRNWAGVGAQVKRSKRKRERRAKEKEASITIAAVFDVPYFQSNPFPTEEATPRAFSGPMIDSYGNMRHGV